MRNFTHKINTSFLTKASWLLLFVLCIALPKSYADTWCEASFQYTFNINANTISQEINLQNTSEGYFSTVNWMVDGEYCTGIGLNDQGGNYTFPGAGTYEVCVEVININSYCYSIYCEEITAGQNDPCFYMDCVFPGDANGDGVATNFDLLPIGLHYGASGPARPNATSEWNGQSAPDWDETTSNGVNLKHLDCNGDGIIDLLDMYPIIDNYEMTQNQISIGDANDETPDLFLVYDENEIIINDNDSVVLVTGQIHVGTAQAPINNLHGIAFGFSFNNELIQNGSFSVEMLTNSWLGNNYDFMQLEVDMQEELDIAYSRMDNFANSGYGPIASFSYVISDDLIGKRDDVLLRIEMGTVEASDQNGNDRMIDVLTTEIPIRFSTTSLRTYNEEAVLKVYPNPVKDRLAIQLDGHEAKSVRIFDALGKEVLRRSVSTSAFQLSLDHLNKGIYFLEVETTKGNFLNQRILVD